MRGSRWLAACVGVVLVGGVAAAPALAGVDVFRKTWERRSSIAIGYKFLDEAWGDADGQWSVGLLSEWRRVEWPFWVASDIVVSGKRLDDFDVVMAEMFLGGRFVLREWRYSRWLQPYVGLGPDILYAKSSDEEGNADRTFGFGYWVGGGIYSPVDKKLHMGLDLRYSQVDVDNAVDEPGSDVNGGGLYFFVTAGVLW